MSEEHEPSYYVNESAESFESGLWDGPGADEFDPYPRFDVNYDFEAEFGLTTSESAGLETPDQAASNIEQTEEVRGAENERDASDSEAFPHSTLEQPRSGTENEPPANALDNFPDPVQPLVHIGQPPAFSTPGRDSGYNSTAIPRGRSHTMMLPAPHSLGEDAVQTTSPRGDPSWPVQAQHGLSETEDHSSADEEERLPDNEELSNCHNAQGNSDHEQFQYDFGMGNENLGQNAASWDFPIDDLFGPINTNVELLQQPEFSMTGRPSVFGDEKDDDPNNSDRDDEDDEDEDDEYYEEEDLPSQFISVTYPVNDPLIVEDPTQKRWGRTGVRNGNEVWFNPKTYKWQPSASHHDMRETLIARAQQEYPDDKYIYPDKTDGLPHAETAFFKPHQARGPNREDCPDALFVWRDWKAQDDKPIYKRGHPGYMYEGNRILLDSHNNPVVNHKFIPLTLSARTHASKLQEMALNSGCKQGDLWARMPRWERKKDKNNAHITIPLRGKNTRINMPMVRFREKKGTIAGENREGTRGIIEGLTAFYRHHGFDPKISGSTRRFGRDLKGWEIKQVRLGNAGQFGTRAGPRALDEEKKADNQKKLENAIRNGQEEDASGTRKKRKRPAHDQGDVNGDDHDANKRPKKSVSAKPGGSSTQSRGSRRSASITQRYGTYGAAQPQLHNMSPMGLYQQLQTQTPNNQYAEGQYQSLYPGIGMELASGLNQSQRTPSGSMRAQYGRGQANAGQSFPTQPYVPQHLVRGDADHEPVRAHGGFGSPEIFGEQEQQTPTTAKDIEENRRLRLRQEIYGQPLHQNRVRNELISNTDMSHLPHGHVSNERNRKRGANTLGPGGRNAHQTPEQVLGKRRQRDTEDAQIDGEVPGPIVPKQNFQSWKPTVTNNIQHEQSNLPASEAPAVESQQKRRRTNGTPVAVLEPQHRRHNVPNVRSRRPKQYGPGGAPQPKLPPGEALKNSLPEGSYMTPEEVDRMRGDIFDLPTSETPDEESTHLTPSKTSTKETAPQRQIDPETRSPQTQPNADRTLPRVPPTPQATNLQQPDLLNAPTPAFSDQTAPFDIRDVRPTTDAQSQSLQNALSGTRQVYTAWTKEEAPPTDLEESYNEQYQEIRAAFHAWWRSQQRPEPVPGLWYMQAWEGGVEDWPAP